MRHAHPTCSCLVNTMHPKKTRNSALQREQFFWGTTKLATTDRESTRRRVKTKHNRRIEFSAQMQKRKPCLTKQSLHFPGTSIQLQYAVRIPTGARALLYPLPDTVKKLPSQCVSPDFTLPLSWHHLNWSFEVQLSCLSPSVPQNIQGSFRSSIGNLSNVGIKSLGREQ